MAVKKPKRFRKPRNKAERQRVEKELLEVVNAQGWEWAMDHCHEDARPILSELKARYGGEVPRYPAISFDLKQERL